MGMALSSKRHLRDGNAGLPGYFQFATIEPHGWLEYSSIGSSV
jgi:hypothetical protein